MIVVETEEERRLIISAFVRWKKNRPGTLVARSRKDGEVYRVEFIGISPAEIAEARIAGDRGDI